MDKSASERKDSEIDRSEGEAGSSRFTTRSGVSSLAIGDLKTRSILSTLFIPVGVIMSCKRKRKVSKIDQNK